MIRFQKKEARATKEEILNMISEERDSKFLDIGCALGNFTIECAEKINTKNIFGIEVHKEKIEIAEKKGIKVYNFDLNEDFKLNETFDIVISTQIIEHIFNPDKFLRNIKKILAPDGYAIIATPNLSSFHNVLSLSMGYQPTSYWISEYQIGNPLNPLYQRKYDLKHGHVRVFSHRALKDILTIHGFEIIKMKGSGFYPFPNFISKILVKLFPIYAANLIVKFKKRNKRK